MDFKFKLGQTVKDCITNFEGVVFSRSQWLANCNTYGIKSRELREGKPMELVYFDEPNLVLISDNKDLVEKRDTGGPDRPVSQTNRF